ARADNHAAPVDGLSDRELEVFRLEGRCGLCEYRELCGGSRARAYAATGNYLSEDASCIYDPMPALAGTSGVT
ncbi:MAG: hypothetical protein O3C57_05645, partial [Verrucomicrobia bacterium]|nr:hypothetical protein [Verrucomicrobiota bacterium]